MAGGRGLGCIAAACLAAALSLTVTAGPAAAGEFCDTQVATSGLVDDSATARVAATAATLADRNGVFLVVRLLDSTPAGLESWFAATSANCPSWQRGVDGRTPRLLVVAVSVGDRRTGTWYGADLGNVLETRYLDVHEAMVPSLRAGDWAGALEVGLTRYDDLLAAAAPLPSTPPLDLRAPPPPTSPGSTTDDAAPPEVRPAPGVRDEPARDDPAGDAAPALWGLVGGGAAIGGGFLYKSRLDDRRRRRARLDDAARRRELVKQQYESADRRWEALVNAATDVLTGVDRDDSLAIQIGDERSQASVQIERVTEGFLTAEFAYPDDVGSRSIEDLDAIVDRWTALERETAGAVAELDDLDGAVARLRDAVAEHAEVLAAADQAAADAALALATVAADGYRTTAFQSELDGATRLLATARTFAGGRRPGDAHAAASSALVTIRSVLDRSTDVPARHRQLLDQQALVAATVPELDDIVADVTRRITELGQHYARSAVSSLEPVEADITAAQRAIHRLVDETSAALTMEAQLFDEADALFADAHSTIAAIRALATQLASFESELATATVEMPGAIDHAAGAHAATTAFVQGHVRDVDASHAGVLVRAGAVIDEARAAATAVRPDPFQAVHRAREATSLLDRVLHTARSEHEARQAARDRAKTAIRDAHRAIDDARRHDGFGMFGWSARAHATLDAATASLGRASAMAGDDPEGAIRIADRAEADAREVIREARRRNDNGGGSGFGFGSSGGSSFGFSSGSFGSSSGGSSSGGSSSGSSGGGTSGW